MQSKQKNSHFYYLFISILSILSKQLCLGVHNDETTKLAVNSAEEKTTFNPNVENAGNCGEDDQMMMYDQLYQSAEQVRSKKHYQVGR